MTQEAAVSAWLAGILTASLIGNAILLLVLNRFQDRDERQQRQNIELHKRLTYAEASLERAAQRRPRVSDWVD